MTCVRRVLGLGVLLTCVGGAHAQASFEVRPLDVEVAREYDLDMSFFKKATFVQEILIVTSERVPDLVHHEAAYQFDQIMRSVRQEVAERIRNEKVLCILLGAHELTSDLPQFKTDKTGKELDFYNWRQRGFLTRHQGRPTVVFAEEDVLEYEGGMQRESILIHEFGHVIHNAGFDDAQNAQLSAAFDRARSQGLWMDGRAAQRFRRVQSKTPVLLLDALEDAFPQRSPVLLKKCLQAGDILVNGEPSHARVLVTSRDKVLIRFGGEKECYAHRNRAEYWAEGVQSWYDTNRTMDHDHNHIHTRAQLKEYDPALAKLCAEVLGDYPWRFVSPRKRAGQGHLKAYDLRNAPQVEDPPHIMDAANDYYDKYWDSFWKRLTDKHALAAKLQAEGAEALAVAAHESGDAVRGAILFADRTLACTACHGRNVAQALGPDLTQMPTGTSDAYLAEALLTPSKVIREGFEQVQLVTELGLSHSGRLVSQSDETVVLQPADPQQPVVRIAQDAVEALAPLKVSIMPELVDQLEDRQAFLDLLKYLTTLRDGGQMEVGSTQQEGTGPPAQLLRGLALLDAHLCLRCHQHSAAELTLPPKRAPRLAQTMAGLRPDYVEAFLQAPQQVKPGSTMPAMLAGLPVAERRQAAVALTHFLKTQSAAAVPTRATPVEDKQAALERGAALYHQIGCATCHDGERDAVPLGNPAAKYMHVEALAAFLENPLAHRPRGRMPDLKLTHFEALDLAGYLWQRLPAPAHVAWRVDGELAKVGRSWFQRLECVRCHDGFAGETAQRIPLVANRLSSGCLSNTAGAWPRYTLGARERAELRHALQANFQDASVSLQLAHALTTLRCDACHTRGALREGVRAHDPFFHSADPNLGPQGRLPPTLDGVGRKLTPGHLRKVLVAGTVRRPYLKTRMPRFGAESVAHLVDLFARADGWQAQEEQPRSREQLKQVRADGHALVSQQGLNCIACHTFQRKPGATMSALDLTEMAQALNRHWFMDFMRAPQRFHPGTVMPTFWPQGKSIRGEILGGDPQRQLEALWVYLQDGRQARVPRGLVREPMELVAVEEAVLLRRSYPGVGKRGIGVGYPAQVNMVFDAEQMRVAMLWAGKFADPSGVWRSQGHGSVRPLAREVSRFAPGPEIHLSGQDWNSEQDRPQHHRFLGYTLDERERPTFRYRLQDVEIEDALVDVMEPSGTPKLNRTIRLTSDRPRHDLVFRIASEQPLVAEGRALRVGDHVQVELMSPHEGRLGPSGKRWLVPLELPAGQTELRLEYRFEGDRS